MNLCIPVADDFLMEISPGCSVVNRDLPWKQSELYNLFFLQIQLNISLQATHFTIYFPKQRDIIVFISDDRH
jgi:hypothetical protein